SGMYRQLQTKLVACLAGFRDKYVNPTATTGIGMVAGNGGDAHRFVAIDTRDKPQSGTRAVRNFEAEDRGSGDERAIRGDDAVEDPVEPRRSKDSKGRMRQVD